MSVTYAAAPPEEFCRCLWQALHRAKNTVGATDADLTNLNRALARPELHELSLAEAFERIAEGSFT